MRQFKRLRRGACAAAIATAILMPVVAFAHVFPQTQTPSAGAEVPAPAKVTIVFDGPLEPAFSSLTVSNSTDKPVNTAKAVIDQNDRKSISVALPPLPPDKYTVHWVAVAADGHRTHGDYSFRVK
ncbi:copper resistance protein [Burkholderia sp. FL-7-2-10-S1-D7]|uniref:copper resistance CopC family protein n=1 Tax=Burkholderia sp. FL-7-2-10-S1-D7 TaxID=1637866 RepID=UPI000752A774|nr:copper resistance protein CopC [Burkholderia sp. FL-7-2-10-S1-D7]KVF72490.1 copper resistance protein [Burkholderia sp. FL-7-2-10-S1-D7]